MNMSFDERLLFQHLPPVLQCAAHEVLSMTQAPASMIVSSLLSTASVACQSLVDVQYRLGSSRPTPVGLYFLTLAESGERKTTVDGLVSAPLFSHDELRASFHRQELKIFNAKSTSFKAKSTALKRQISKAIQDGTPTEKLEVQLEQLELAGPQEPPSFRVCYQDVTVEALGKAMHRHSPSACLISSEAAGILRGRAGQSTAFYNQAWDGGTILVDRVKGDPLTLTNVRLTCNFMIQPGMMQQYLVKRGEDARSSGFLARFLVAFPSSTQGFRYVNPFDLPSATNGLKVFHDMVGDLLARSDVHNSQVNLSRQVMTLDQAASSAWAGFFNEVEALLVQGGAYSDIRDSASKIAENVARLAAVIHFWGGDVGPINQISMFAATTLGRYYLQQFQMLFGRYGYFSSAYQATAAMEQFLVQYFQRNPGCQMVTRHHLARNAPSHCRSGESIDGALELLRLQGKVTLVNKGRTLEIYWNWRSVGRITAYQPLTTF